LIVLLKYFIKKQIRTAVSALFLSFTGTIHINRTKVASKI
jgi:hypothetical protein